MPGEIYKRKDGNFAFRVKASNGQTVATDGGQGYSRKASARSTLTKLLAGGYDSGEVYKRRGGDFAFRVKASNGQIVATDGSQGYGKEATAQKTLDKLLAGGYDGKITEE